jgi:formylglycine-generating enzyme required for sulfatase activity
MWGNFIFLTLNAYNGFPNSKIELSHSVFRCSIYLSVFFSFFRSFDIPLKNYFFILLALQLTIANAQSVSQVEITQDGKTIVVEYLLEAPVPQEILLYLSQDGGISFSNPLQKVNGDVGKEITPGKKRMRWNVLEELPELIGDNVVFKVEIAGESSGDAAIKRPKLEWVTIPAGSFRMGSPEEDIDRDSDESSDKWVTVSGFKMGKYEITFDQYDAFCEATGREKPDDFGWGRGNRPVINVNWNDASAFSEWMGFRLPTESEWEYACRAGTTTPFNTGNLLNSNQANFNKNIGRTSPVGSYPPNAWGLFDMHGNVWEWCSDAYDDDSSGNQPNPNGPAIGAPRVLRGGSWFNYGRLCRSAHRNYYSPSNRDGNIGFRLVAPN